MKPVYTIAATMIWAVSGIAAAADDYKVIKLEQDMRRLEQQVRDLSREIAELRRQSGAPALSAPREQQKAAESPSSPPWLQAKNWQRLRVGMSELEVIEALGPPTSTRVADGASRILFYALEIDTGSFLGGNVELRDRRVVEINTPVLK